MRVFKIAGLASIAILAAGAATAGTQALPHQKLGLWQSETTMAGQHFLSQLCIDAASEAKMSAFSSQVSQKNCQRGQISHNPDGSWSSVTTCEFRPGAKSTSRAVITGDFSSKYTMVLRSPPDAAPEMTMVMTWIGPCKPGQRGGDVIMNGTKMNVLDTESPVQRGAAPH